MEERIYTLRLELTDSELGAIMRALNLYVEDWNVSEETYEIVQSVLSKLEEAM